MSGSLDIRILDILVAVTGRMLPGQHANGMKEVV
jgi:hypothetical protein